jgi:hypothetical protein
MEQTRFSRRTVLGSVGAVSVAPALPGDGDESARLSVHTEPAFAGTIFVGPQQRGTSQAHFSAAILGGEVSGPLLQGQVLPGRIEWTIDAGSQTMQLSASYAVRCADGSLVQVRDRSVQGAAAAPAAGKSLRTVPELHADGELGGLSGSVLVGVLDASGFSAGQVMLRVFRVV